MQNLTQTILKLEELIRKLEIATGTPHKESPFAKHNITPPAKAQAADKPEKAEKAKKAPEAGEAAAPKEPKEPKEAGAAKAPKEGKKGGEGKPKAAPAAALDPVLEDFTKCEFRIGEFESVWVHPQSEKLYCEKINIGKEVREIASGLQKFVPLDGMKGRCLVWVNLKSKKLADFPSHGMVMCASDKKVAGEEKVELVRPNDNAKVGERLFLDGHEDKFPDAAVEPVSSKVLERVVEKFKTDEHGNIVYNGILVKTASGALKQATLVNSSVS